MAASCCDQGCSSAPSTGDARYRRVLWIALAVNLAMFAVEIVAGLLSHSVSLRADALDFLGDAANYALALVVFGRTLGWRAQTALLKGVVMGTFGLWVATTTIYHGVQGKLPTAEVMGPGGLVGLTGMCFDAAWFDSYVYVVGQRRDGPARTAPQPGAEPALLGVARLAAGAEGPLAPRRRAHEADEELAEEDG